VCDILLTTAYYCNNTHTQAEYKHTDHTSWSAAQAKAIRPIIIIIVYYADKAAYMTNTYKMHTQR